MYTIACVSAAAWITGGPLDTPDRSRGIPSHRRHLKRGWRRRRWHGALAAPNTIYAARQARGFTAKGLSRSATRALPRHAGPFGVVESPATQCKCLQGQRRPCVEDSGCQVG